MPELLSPSTTAAVRKLKGAESERILKRFEEKVERGVSTFLSGGLSEVECFLELAESEGGLAPFVMSDVLRVYEAAGGEEMNDKTASFVVSELVESFWKACVEGWGAHAEGPVRDALGVMKRLGAGDKVLRNVLSFTSGGSLAARVEYSGGAHSAWDVRETAGHAPDSRRFAPFFDLVGSFFGRSVADELLGGAVVATCGKMYVKSLWLSFELLLESARRGRLTKPTPGGKSLAAHALPSLLLMTETSGTDWSKPSFANLVEELVSAVAESGEPYPFLKTVGDMAAGKLGLSFPQPAGGEFSSMLKSDRFAEELDDAKSAAEKALASGIRAHPTEAFAADVLEYAASVSPSRCSRLLGSWMKKGLVDEAFLFDGWNEPAVRAGLRLMVAGVDPDTSGKSASEAVARIVSMKSPEKLSQDVLCAPVDEEALKSAADFVIGRYAYESFATGRHAYESGKKPGKYSKKKYAETRLNPSFFLSSATTYGSPLVVTVAGKKMSCWFDAWCAGVWGESAWAESPDTKETRATAVSRAETLLESPVWKDGFRKLFSLPPIYGTPAGAESSWKFLVSSYTAAACKGHGGKNSRDEIPRSAHGGSVFLEAVSPEELTVMMKEDARLVAKGSGCTETAAGKGLASLRAHSSSRLNETTRNEFAAYAQSPIPWGKGFYHLTEAVFNARAENLSQKDLSFMNETSYWIPDEEYARRISGRFDDVALPGFDTAGRMLNRNFDLKTGRRLFDEKFVAEVVAASVRTLSSVTGDDGIELSKRVMAAQTLFRLLMDAHSSGKLPETAWSGSVRIPGAGAGGPWENSGEVCVQCSSTNADERDVVFRPSNRAIRVRSDSDTELPLFAAMLTAGKLPSDAETFLLKIPRFSLSGPARPLAFRSSDAERKIFCESLLDSDDCVLLDAAIAWNELSGESARNTFTAFSAGPRRTRGEILSSRLSSLIDSRYEKYGDAWVDAAARLFGDVFFGNATPDSFVEGASSAVDVCSSPAGPGCLRFAVSMLGRMRREMERQKYALRDHAFDVEEALSMAEGALALAMNDSYATEDGFVDEPPL